MLTLDKQIISLELWIPHAAAALISFYDEENAKFNRNNLQTEEIKKDISPTATLRSFAALSEYFCFLTEQKNAQLSCQNDYKLKVQESYPTTFDADYVRSKAFISKVLLNIAKRFSELLVRDPNRIRTSAENGVNAFTDGHLLTAVSILKYLLDRRMVEQKVDLHDIINECIKKCNENIVLENIKNLDKFQGGRVGNINDKELTNKKNPTHDYITLYSLRGLDFYSDPCQYSSGHPPNLEQIKEKFKGQIEQMYNRSIRQRVKEDALKQLAFRFAGIYSKFDPGELVFSISILNRSPDEPDLNELTERSIEVIAESQTKEGTWPTAKMIMYGDFVYYVTSYEVALTLTYILFRKVYERDISGCEDIVAILDKTFDFIKLHFVSVDNVRGWVNDHAQFIGLIESWTTAIVLTFLIKYREALMQLRQQIILERYTTAFPKISPLKWPDLYYTIGLCRTIDLSLLDSYPDPFGRFALSEKIKSDYLKPIEKSPIQRPENRNSLILYGERGSRKTDLVKKIGETLNWPILTLTASNFLRRGLKEFDTVATEIFEDLLRLRRVVIHFDKCEEFFRYAENGQVSIENRTEGAFLTPGILHRLQSLHDMKWVIFLVESNNLDITKFDPAIVSNTIFDNIQRIDHPVYDAQVEYVKRMIDSSGTSDASVIIDALKKFDKERSDYRSSVISFYILDQLVNIVKSEHKQWKSDDIKKEIEKLVKYMPAPPLIDNSEGSSL
jgi:hypothetical protein